MYISVLFLCHVDLPPLQTILAKGVDYVNESVSRSKWFLDVPDMQTNPVRPILYLLYNATFVSP